MDKKKCRMKKNFFLADSGMVTIFKVGVNSKMLV
jgi:hypothetical protein